MDIRAMAQAAVQVAELMRDPAIQSLDINPLMLGSDGEGYAVVDAVVIRDARDADQIAQRGSGAVAARFH